jgi:hypothetical protein
LAKAGACRPADCTHSVTTAADSATTANEEPAT